MMMKKYLVLSLLPLLLLTQTFFSCSQGAFSMKDGHYTAEAAEFDEHGWKEYVTICVSSGRIVTVEYNAFNPSGFIKSWDIDYMRTMSAWGRTYPNAYTRFYAGQLLGTQEVSGIDCLAGATNSYHSFLLLADAVIENARQGRKEITAVATAEPAGNDGHALVTY
jgi:major membrane immunogen (membrane-anchored lipoprotein)